MRNYKPLFLILGAIAVGPVLAGEAGDAQAQASALLRSAAPTAPVRFNQEQGSVPSGSIRSSAQTQASELLQGAHVATKALSVASNRTTASAAKTSEDASMQAQRMLRGETLSR